MKTAREQFEDWAKGQGRTLEKYITHDEYKSLVTQRAWDTWKAATEAIKAEERERCPIAPPSPDYIRYVAAKLPEGDVDRIVLSAYADRVDKAKATLKENS